MKNFIIKAAAIIGGFAFGAYVTTTYLKSNKKYISFEDNNLLNDKMYYCN